MLPCIDKERDNGLFAKSFGCFQPVQTFDKYARFRLAILWFDHDEARDHPNRGRLCSDQASCDPRTETSIAASILDKGLLSPILVRADGARFVLVEGLHRLEAAKALGEQTIVAFLVDARKH